MRHRIVDRRVDPVDGLFYGGEVTIHLLAMHAGYRCRHAGVCCTEDWTIPVDAARHAQLTQALGDRRLQPEQRAGRYFLPLAHSGEAAVLARIGRSCAFFEPGRGRLCAVHRTFGHDAIPTACQHFPRVVTMDPRGMFVSLSHVCPTAGSLLHEPHADPFAIVNAGAVIGDNRTWAGLDATGALPPQVNEGALWDWEGLSAWESCVLGCLGLEQPEAALAAAAHAAARLSDWSPARGRLADCVDRAFEDAPRARAPIDVVRLDASAREAAGSARAIDPVTHGRFASTESAWRTFAPQVARYVAARTVASEVAYHALDARALSRWLDTTYAVLRVEVARLGTDDGRALQPAAISAAAAGADRLLVHGIDAARLARSLAERPR